jgi:Cd2+/Zn2+-exporting ATPase
MSDIRIKGYVLPRKRAVTFAAAFALWVLGIIITHFFPHLSFIPLFFSWFLAGYPVLKNAAKNFYSRKALGKTLSHCLDENFLMSAATIGAFAIGAWEEAAGVMLFYLIGEIIQEAAIEKSRSSINDLLALKPDKARVKDGDDWKETPAGEVSPGSLVLVRPGERIPLDGIIIEGEASVDASMLTGEPRPVHCATGSEVFSGTVSLNGVLRIKTTKSAGESSAARIVQLVESAREVKAKPERFITSFARWYTPIVVGTALLLAVLPPLLVPGARFADWIYRALVLLVISCPCALVVSVPLGYFAGIGGMSRRGIMVKGAVHLDSLCRAKNVAFDKTGTLTKGNFSVASLEPVPETSRKTLLETAVLAEQESNHPIAKAILEYAKKTECGMETGDQEKEERGSPGFYETAGQGVEVITGEIKIIAGNRRFLESRQINIPASDSEGTFKPVYIARNNSYLGRILIGDTLKEGAVEAVNQLKEMGIRNSIFTGDTRSSAMEAASRLGISENSVEAQLLPEDKLREVEKLCLSGTTVFVGDGINDAPVLARSHVGIAMGSGADVAVEAADLIVMTDDPRRIPEAIERARKTRRIVVENVTFALGAKGAFITLAAMGMANMWIALIADVGVTLIAILNSTRALGVKTGPHRK